jgi:hypothetical protein
MESRAGDAPIEWKPSILMGHGLFCVIGCVGAMRADSLALHLGRSGNLIDMDDRQSATPSIMGPIGHQFRFIFPRASCRGNASHQSVC